MAEQGSELPHKIGRVLALILISPYLLLEIIVLLTGFLLEAIFYDGKKTFSINWILELKKTDYKALRRRYLLGSAFFGVIILAFMIRLAMI